MEMPGRWLGSARSGWLMRAALVNRATLPALLVVYNRHALPHLNTQFAMKKDNHSNTFFKGLTVYLLTQSNPIRSIHFAAVSGSKDLPNSGGGTFWCLTQDAVDSGHRVLTLAPSKKHGEFFPADTALSTLGRSVFEMFLSEFLGFSSPGFLHLFAFRSCLFCCQYLAMSASCILG